MSLEHSIHPLEKLKSALEKAELDKYLIGEGDYEFPNPWVEEPTDLGVVFILGFDLYVKEYGEGFLNDEIEKALRKLIETPIGCWWVIVIIHSFKYRFIENALKFNIEIEKLVPDLNVKLKYHKSELMNNMSWVGYRFNMGLWEQIENFVPEINKILSENRWRKIDL